MRRTGPRALTRPARRASHVPALEIAVGESPRRTRRSWSVPVSSIRIPRRRRPGRPAPLTWGTHCPFPCFPVSGPLRRPRLHRMSRRQLSALPRRVPRGFLDRPLVFLLHDFHLRRTRAGAGNLPQDRQFRLCYGQALGCLDFSPAGGVPAPVGPAGRSPTFRPLCSLGPVGPGGDGGQLVRVRQVVGVLAFALTAPGPSAGAVSVVQRDQWSTSRSLGLVIVWPVKSPYHCPVLTRHRRSVLYVTPVRLSAVSTSWRVSWQSPS